MNNESKQKKEIIIVASVLIFLIGVLIFSNVKKIAKLFIQDKASIEDVYSQNKLLEEALSKKDELTDVEKNEVKDAKESNEIFVEDTVLVEKNVKEDNFISNNNSNRIIRLSCPKRISLNLDTLILTCSVVDGAAGYKVRIDNLSNKTSNEVYTITNSTNISNYLNKPGIYNISVKTVPVNTLKYKESASSTKIELDKRQKLDKIENINYKDNKLTFSKVENAVRYEIYLKNKVTNETKVYSTDKTEYNLDIDKLGKIIYGVSVKAVPNEALMIHKPSDMSNEFSIDNRIILESVTNIRYTDSETYIYWDEVKNADGYIVELKDKISNKKTFQNVNTNRIYINNLDKTNYIINVQPKSNNHKMYKSPDFSGNLNVDLRMRISGVNNLFLDESNKKIIWDEIQDAKEYQVSITYNLNNNINQTNITVTEPYISVNGLYEDFNSVDISINVIPSENIIRESGYSKVAYFPYVRNIELVNPNENNNIHYVIVEMPGDELIEGELSIEENKGIKRKFTLKEMNIFSNTSKSITFEELNKLNPGSYTLRLDYKINLQDTLRTSIKKVNVKQSVRNFVQRVNNISGNVEYKVQKNENIKEYNISIKGKNNQLNETFVVTDKEKVFNLTQFINDKKLPYGRYEIEFKPIVKNTSLYTVSLDSIYKEEVSIEEEHIIEEVQAKDNITNIKYTAINKEGYSFVRLEYENKLIDGMDKYYYEDSNKNNIISVDKKNYKDTDKVYAVYKKIR